MARLKGKIVLITGAASGIGAGIARAFAAEGAFVIATDINDVLGRELADSIGASAVYERLGVRLETDWTAAT